MPTPGFTLNATDEHQYVPVGGLEVFTPPRCGAWTLWTHQLLTARDGSGATCSHGHPYLLHAPSGDARAGARTVVLHSPDVHAMNAHDGVWATALPDGAPVTQDAAHVLKFRPAGSDPRHYRGVFVPLQPCSATYHLNSTRYVVDVTQSADGALHVFVHATPHAWHGLDVAHATGNVNIAASGHTGADAVMDAAEHHGATIDPYGVPRYYDGTMVRSGVNTPGTTKFLWTDAAFKCAWNGGCGVSGRQPARQLSAGLLHHGVSSGDPDVFATGTALSAAARPAVVGSAHHGGMAHMPQADTADVNEAADMIYVLTSFDEEQHPERGVVQCKRLSADILRAAVTHAHLQEERGADATPAALRSPPPRPPRLGGDGPTSTCTPTLDAGSGATPNCGEKTSDDIMKLAIAAVVNSGDMSSDAKKFCKAIKLFGAKDAAKNNTSCG